MTRRNGYPRCHWKRLRDLRLSACVGLSGSFSKGRRLSAVREQKIRVQESQERRGKSRYHLAKIPLSVTRLVTSSSTVTPGLGPAHLQHRSQWKGCLWIITEAILTSRRRTLTNGLVRSTNHKSMIGRQRRGFRSCFVKNQQSASSVVNQ